MKTKILRHSFVKFIPDTLEENVLYISIDYCTAMHHCVCGCGNRVVTPISPTDWQLTFNGETVSLKPSIGNWNFKCQSHYWIKGGKIEWDGQWSKEEIDAGRDKDWLKKKTHFDHQEVLSADTNDNAITTAEQKPEKSFWDKLRILLRL